MKKLLAIVLASCLALSMVACGGKTPSTPDSAAATPDPAATAASTADKTETGAKVGVCIYKFDDNFMTLYRNALQEKLEGMGYEVTVVDGKNDQATQSEQVDTFISQGVDVLVVNLVQSTAATTVIDKAKAADIPVVFINREPTKEDLATYDKCCYVGADARQSGTF
ncbi:MAG: substrate-binding domain-containing protein, partial [Ruthenibacterium sp.]